MPSGFRLFASAYIILLAGLVAGGWLFSSLGLLGAWARLAPLWGAAVAVFSIKVGRGCWSDWWGRLRQDVVFWPFLLLLVLILAAAAIYPPWCMIP